MGSGGAFALAPDGFGVLRALVSDARKKDELGRDRTIAGFVLPSRLGRARRAEV